MADTKYLKKLNVGGVDYLLKDEEARNRLTIAEADIDALETGKQDVIDASHKLAAAYVSLDKPEGSKLASADVQAAVYELEAAIEKGGTGSIVNVVKKDTAESGYFATYEITQGGEKVGASINIPKDFLVKSAQLKTAGASDPSGFPEGTKYIDFVVNSRDASATDEHIYLNVADLVDAYLADESTLHMENNTFSVKAVPMNLVTGLADALDLKADKTALQAEITRAEAAEALKEDKANLKAFAYADKGSATVASKTVANVGGSATVTGSVTVTMEDSDPQDAVIAEKISFQPSGTVAASATDGSFSALTKAEFKIDNANGVQIGGTNAASSVTVDSSNATVLGSVKTAAVAPSFTDNVIGTFVKPTLTIAESDSFAKAGLTAAVADETLTLTAADTGKASVCSGWTQGSWTAGTFNAGSAAEFENATVIGSITGGTAAAQTFTGNKYTVETANDTALKNVEFTGTTVANLIPNKITYLKPEVKSAEFAQTAGTIAVNDIVVPSQDIEVSPANA